jgi:NTP pyrophosphatase (non-canonical NTP hydrolase)
MQTEEYQSQWRLPSLLTPLFPLKRFAKRTHETAKSKGFYADPVIMDKVAGKLALVHSEVTEVLEALRKDQGKDKVTQEVVDILIRTLSLHEWLVELDLATDDLDDIMGMVMDRNDARPSMHGHRWG